MTDPISVSGLALGVASLAFDVFDRSVGLFKFFCSIVDMPKDCQRCRLQLTIEYNRFLAWGNAVGLVDVRSESQIATTLGTNSYELCAIVTRIGRLLEEFKEINERWTKDLTTGSQDDFRTKGEATAIDLRAQVSSLAVQYERNREKHRNVSILKRITAPLSKGVGNAKEIVTNPSRVRWVMVDKFIFDALLKELHNLVERIHELMSDYRGKEIHESTTKTYREMLIARNDLCDIKDMLYALTKIMTTSPNVAKRNRSYEDENETLHDLLMLKQLRCVSDEVLLRAQTNTAIEIERNLREITNITCYDGATFDEKFTCHTGDGMEIVLDPRRPRGILRKEGKDFEVWVEWRKTGTSRNGSSQNQEAILRTAALAQMLSLRKPRHLYSPNCIAFVDDCARRDRIGWIFEMPTGSHPGARLQTLHSMLGKGSQRPNLAERISLAWKLASSLLFLHTSNWLHKGIHSGNILFSGAEEVEFAKPIVSGFEYSRPESNKTTSRSMDPKWDVYRWPRCQNGTIAAGDYRKTYDIYSLGLVLLEVAHWQPLHKLMMLNMWPIPASQACRVRGWLLEDKQLLEEGPPPFGQENPLVMLRDNTGDIFYKAVRRCLVAHGCDGMGIDEQYDQSGCPEIGLRLQNAFSESVVEMLKSVSV